MSAVGEVVRARRQYLREGGREVGKALDAPSTSRSSLSQLLAHSRTTSALHTPAPSSPVPAPTPAPPAPLEPRLAAAATSMKPAK